LKKIVYLYTVFTGETFTKESFCTLLSTVWKIQDILKIERFANDEANLYGLELFSVRAFKQINQENPPDTMTFEDFAQYVKVLDHPSQVLETQTGGRLGSFKIVGEGRLTKKVDPREYDFYVNTLKRVSGLSNFCPQFFGTIQEDGNNLIIFEDLCRGFSKPCVLDLKIGTTRVGDDTIGERREYMHNKDKGSTTVSIGLRFIGMRVWNKDTESFDRYNKSWGRAVTDDTFGESMLVFLRTSKTDQNLQLIPLFLEKILPLYEWMQTQNELRFFSSSLLLVFDGQNPDSVRLKMIDFAHVFPTVNGVKDDGYVLGLSNLVKIFKSLEKGL